VISDFSREVGENCTRVGYYAVSGGNSLPTFRYNLSVPSSRVKNLNLEDGTYRSSRNFGKESPPLVAQ